MDVAELHSRALDATRGVIAGVRQGQWAAPTPCPGWDVRALVNHVAAGNLWAAELTAGATISEVGDHLDGDLLGADRLGAYDASAKAAAAVFAWTDLGLTPDRSATLTVHSDVAYVVGQQGAGPIAPSLDVFAGTRPVRHESLPCGQGQAYVPFAPLGTSTDGLVYLVCDVMNNQPSPPAQTQLAYESANEGSSWSPGHPPPPQPPQGVTAVPGGRFAWNSGPDLYMLTGHGWHVSLTGRGHGFSLVGFETNTQGVALGTNGYLWITRNGGTSWSRVTV